MTERALTRSRKNIAIQFAVGAVIGAAGGYLAMHYGADLDASGAHAPGLFVAALLLLLGIAIVGTSFSRASVAQMLGPEPEPGEDLQPEIRSIRWQGFVTLLAGVELVILSLAPQVLTGPNSALLLGLIALTIAVQTWFNLRLWRSGDELFRQVIVEAGVIGFIVFQFALFFWVVGARFGFVADPSALDIYVLMMVLYLAGSSIASIRRGYGTG